MGTININGVDTDITVVDFNGDSDILEVQLNGEVVWVKAPTALQVVQALVADTGWTSTDRNATRVDTYAKLHHFIQDNSGNFTFTLDSDYSSLTGAMASSPYVSSILLSYGTDDAGGVMGQFSYVPVGGSSTNVTTSENTRITGGGSGYGLLNSGIAYINKSLPDIDSVSAVCSGARNDLPNGYVNLLLPNKWSATQLSDSAAGSTSLASGEILVVCVAGSGDGYDSSMDTQNSVTHGSNSVVYRHQHWWYQNNSIGIFANATTSSQSISWTKPANARDTMVLKLTQTGIS